MDDTQLINRACRAYFAHAGGEPIDQPGRSESDVVAHKGQRYVALRNSIRTLAVWQITGPVLKPKITRISEWPTALDVW